MSDSFASDHCEFSVDESKLSRENWEDDIGDIDAEKKIRIDVVRCRKKFECAGTASDHRRERSPQSGLAIILNCVMWSQEVALREPVTVYIQTGS